MLFVFSSLFKLLYIRTNRLNLALCEFLQCSVTLLPVWPFPSRLMSFKMRLLRMESWSECVCVCWHVGVLVRLEEPVLYSSKQNNNRRDLPPVVIPRPATAAAAGLKSSSFTAQLTQRGAKLPKCRLCPETPLYSKRTY